MHLPIQGGGPAPWGGQPPMWGGQPPMGGPMPGRFPQPIGPAQPIQGPVNFNPQPQPVGPAPYQPIMGQQQPGVMQNPDVQNFLRRRLGM